jgi:NifU-like protein
MSLNLLWSRFSKKMADRIISPRNQGSFTPQDAESREMRCAIGSSGLLSEGNVVALYWLVDPTDGIIVDAKFQVFGQVALIAAAEAACEILVGKNYEQARRMGVDLIDKKLRDQPELSAFPEETLFLLNLTLEAIEAATIQCEGIPLSQNYVSPVPDMEAPHTEVSEGYPGWSTLSQAQKLQVIEQVLNEEVLPYIQLDGGGIEVQALLHDREVMIAYQGACTTCFSSIGSTLSSIQQILQTKIHADLIVIPNMDALHVSGEIGIL